MRTSVVSTLLLLLAGTVGPVAAQQVGAPSAGTLGTPNPQGPVFIVRPSPTGPFVVVPPGFPFSRQTIPFGDEPHQLNNLYLMLPNAGLGYAVQQVWIPPRPVVMQVYVPMPEGIPARYQTMYAEVPGFYATQTTTGVVLPERWVLDQVTGGVYQWRKAPEQFVPSSSR
jgi:hypothetical protein